MQKVPRQPSQRKVHPPQQHYHEPGNHQRDPNKNQQFAKLHHRNLLLSARVVQFGEK